MVSPCLRSPVQTIFRVRALLRDNDEDKEEEEDEDEDEDDDNDATDVRRWARFTAPADARKSAPRGIGEPYRRVARPPAAGRIRSGIGQVGRDGFSRRN